MNENLSGAWRVYVRATAFVVAVLFAVGTAGHVFSVTLPLMLRLTPWFLLLCGVLVIAPMRAAGGGRFAFWALATYAVTFVAEAVGVSTGAIFGEYAYGKTLGFARWGVPLVIAFNWVLVVHGTSCIADRLGSGWTGRGRAVAIAMLSGVLATVFDFVMEPVAVRLDYWTWAGGAIPLQNYAAWFVIAAFATGARQRWARPPHGFTSACRLAVFYVGVQTLFFAVLRLVWHWQGG